MGTMLAVKLTGPTAADDGTYHSRIYDSNETIIVDNAGDFSLSNGAGSVDQHNLDTSGLGPGEYKVVIYKDMYSGEDSDEDVPYSTVDFTITAPY